MKKIFVVIIILFLQINSYAQSTEKDNCFDTTRYKLESNILYFPELKINIGGEWKTYELIDERAMRFEYECVEIELNKKGSKELIIRWSNAIYGTGGGFTTKGIQIWDLDSGTRLLNEIVSCADENFGRNGNPSYFVECQKQIEIDNQTIQVDVKKCKTEWSTSDEIPDPTSICKLTELKNGKYFFLNDKLKRK